MVNQDWLSQCQSMILINCARGKLIHYPSTLLSIEKGNLKGLGLDVFPIEPHTDMQAVSRLENVIFTPHAAGYHPYLSEQISETLFQLVDSWLKELSLPYEVLEV